MRQVRQWGLRNVSVGRLAYRLAGALGVAGTLLLGTTASAQAFGPWGAWGGGFGYRSSTIEEGAARGAADFVRSAGMKNLLDAQATTQLQETRRQAILNRSLYADTYYKIKDQQLAWKRENVWRTLDQDQVNRIQQIRQPSRLGSNQLDPVTGQISWPIALRMDRFAPYRAETERLFAGWAEQGSDASADTFFALRRSIDSFREILRRNVNDIPTQEYAQASRFLDSLGTEAGFVAGR